MADNYHDKSGSTNIEHGLIDPLMIKNQIENFLREDIGFADLTTTSIFSPTATADFVFKSRQEAKIAGLILLPYIFPDADIQFKVRDGDYINADTRLAAISGSVRNILSRERVALNLLQHLSGIATITGRYVAIIKTSDNPDCILLDSRKTTPGLRVLEKYAVRCGGGSNHRFDLASGVMIKDNHIAACDDDIAAAITKVKSTAPALTKIEIECDNINQVEQALMAGVDMIMLDNMAPCDLSRVVKLVNGRIPLEASGNVTLANLAEIANTGVDYISTSQITRGNLAIDIGLDAIN